MEIKFVILMVCALIGRSVGQLRCYACSFSSSDSDQSCLTISNSTLSVNCPYQYCTIFRQEFVDPGGVIASFMRGCEDQPDFLNHDVTDFNFRTYYRACTTDLCNIGDGIQAVVGGNLSPNPQYTGDNLLVPGTGNGTTTVKINIFVLFAAIMVLCFKSE